MVEDHGEATQRAALQNEKQKLNQAAERLAKLVHELQVTSDDEDIESEDDTMDDDGTPVASDRPILPQSA